MNEIGVALRTLPQVTAIVLNWNRRDETVSCLRSLAGLTYPNLRIIVVDNGSEDDTVKMVGREFPHVRVIENRANLGYAGGNNVGIMRAVREGAEYVFVLNNDVVLDPQALTHAISVAAAHGPVVGVVGFAVYHHEKRDALICIGLESTTGTVLYHAPTEQEMHQREVMPIESAHGCAMLVAKALIDTVGGFDDRFFLNYEEMDLCDRARQAGFHVVAATRARVWHQGSVTFGGEQSPLRLFYLRRNWPLYLMKHFARTNEPECLGIHLKHSRATARWDAGQYLRKGQLAPAFAVLAAVRCAEAGYWGMKNIPWSVRLRVYADMIAVPMETAARKMRRLVGLRRT